jgi:hypothetical protein
MASDTGPMRDGKHGVNSITVAAAELLLTAGGGTAVHLTPTAKTGAGQPAVPDDCFTPLAARRRPGLVNYDRAALLDARWANKTLCGRPWTQMVGGEGGSISPWDEEPEFAPTCKRCLALLDRMFPPPPMQPMHPQLPLIAALWSLTSWPHTATPRYMVCTGRPADAATPAGQVPGTQTDRILLPDPDPREHGVRHLPADLDAARDEYLARAAAAMDGLLAGEVQQPRPDPLWRLSWSAWATD